MPSAYLEFELLLYCVFSFSFFKHHNCNDGYICLCFDWYYIFPYCIVSGNVFFSLIYKDDCFHIFAPNIPFCRASASFGGLCSEGYGLRPKWYHILYIHGPWSKVVHRTGNTVLFGKQPRLSAQGPKNKRSIFSWELGHAHQALLLLSRVAIPPRVPPPPSPVSTGKG